jgi:hypothetical protein
MQKGDFKSSASVIVVSYVFDFADDVVHISMSFSNFSLCVTKSLLYAKFLSSKLCPQSSIEEKLEYQRGIKTFMNILC